MKDIPQEFLDLLNNVNDEIIENIDVDLIENDIISSLDIMNIVSELEKLYHFDFDPSEIIPENFCSVKSLWKIVLVHIKEN